MLLTVLLTHRYSRYIFVVIVCSWCLKLQDYVGWTGTQVTPFENMQYKIIVNGNVVDFPGKYSFLVSGSSVEYLIHNLSLKMFTSVSRI